MPDPIGVGVVGCGYWGPNLVRNFQSLEDCEMKTVCDQDDTTLQRMKRLFPNVNSTHDFGDILKDPEIDAVAIATPLRTHYDLAKAALEAGKHVFVEKPLAGSSRECNELIALSERKKLRLMVGHTFVYTSEVRFMKQVVDSGELGEIYYISSSRLNLGLFQKDINVAWDLAPHDLSIILYLAKEAPVAVNCQGKAHVNQDLEDVTMMTLDFPNGTFATIQSSWLDPNKVRRMTIVGSKGMLVYDDVATNEKIKIYDKRVEVPPHYDTFAEFTYSYHYGDVRIPYLKQMEPLRTETQHFIDCIRSDQHCDSDGEAGLRVVQILEASSRSLKNGGSLIQLPVE